MNIIANFRIFSDISHLLSLWQLLVKRSAIDGPCIHSRAQSKIWLIKSKSNGYHKAWLHNFTSFCIHPILSGILLLCSTSRNKIPFSATIFKNCWIDFVFFYGKFTFLFRWKLVGGHISIFKGHSKLLCADCAVCISMEVGKVPIHKLVHCIQQDPSMSTNFLTHPSQTSLPMRFPEAQNRKMGTESNLHSSPFGMKIEQVYKGMWIQSSYFPSLRLSTYTIYSFGGRSQIVDIFSSRYLFAGAHIFVDIFVWKYLFAGVLIKDIFIWKYLFAGAQGWWGQAGADMSRFQTFNSVCKFAIPGFAFWFGHSVCK